jgi:ribulose-phosphate 3-epimerase
MKIVPAVLAENADDFLLRLKQAEAFADYIQIDMMDGVFVPTTSFPAERINNVVTSLSFEIHLMVKYPSAFIAPLHSAGLKRVLFHFESDVKHLNFIQQMKERGIETGLAVRPETKMEEFRSIAEHVATILFLTVDPGSYGSPFRPEVLDKIREARKIFKDKTISADGGVSPDNLHLFLDAGVDYVCVGSRIFLHGNPAGNYKDFISKLNELEVQHDYSDRR